ncbi:hypothetical protein [Nonomuraea sp. NPDC048826]|uniref:hypothetical protein n=1 Tax=Nonomuraea sp. NPDC048826 TaxID=3364347 RepID=UPI00370F949B
MSLSTPHSNDPLDKIISAALSDVHASAEGLYTQALIMVNDDVTFNQENSYQTAVKTASSGGEALYSLTSKSQDAHPRPHDISEDEARLSSHDSEVAALQDAYDWITGQAITLKEVHKVHVLVVGNIGPCDACKKRLELFFNDIVQTFEGKVTVIVDSVYDTPESNKQAKRHNVASVYGYAKATGHTTSAGKQYWRFRQEFRP